ncbi:dihydroorotase [Candidatus Gracilibacteria bacterium]|nr:dihydroorotase [Candidatus Gracilibacteria bacterium]NJM86630.1 dihydroorotase [Hydrococcus sp. RU_2_2]NJP21467.1 dihydroorotase [Hydrococcus sp. CRU_1_1]
MLSQSKLLLQQVRVIDPLSDTDRIADVLIVGDRIEAIESHLDSIPQDALVYEAQGLILAPGLVDLYSYSGEPGHEERETLASLAAAASAGGFTRVAILPNTIPAIDNPATLALLQQKAESFFEVGSHHSSLSPLSLHFWGAITLGLEGQQMSEFADLAAAGAIGFTDGRPLKNMGLLRRLLEYVKPLNKPIALVPVIESLQGNGVMREGGASINYGLPGNPTVAEAAAIASLLELIAATETPVHLMRVSTRRGVELIADAKARGVPVTASTTWMHLLLNTNDVASYDPNLRLEPPLGNKEDMEALIEGVKQGIIDAIAIDHKGYTYEEKTLSFAEAPPGAIGLELALPLLWERFVESDEWSAIDLWQCLSARPLSCLGQPTLSCTPGNPTELVLFDPKATWTVEQQTLKSRCTNTPWWGKKITGRIVSIIERTK